MTTFEGTDLSEELVGTGASDTLVGKGGDDVIEGAAGDDLIIGDYPENLLLETEGIISFSGYAATGAWQVTALPDGHSQMSQSVETVAGAEYQLTFDIAANLGAGAADAAVEVLWQGEVIGYYEADGGLFEQATVTFTGTGDPGVLEFRSAEPSGDGSIDTSGPIYSYEQVMQVQGQEVTVAAFAGGQPNLYQVLDGTLVVFDTETASYVQAGADATVTINAIGFNAEDDMIYGIAVKNGHDSLGNAVQERDLVMMDADGNSYLVGATPYRSWSGDFDDSGNLWAFEADMDYFMCVDVSERDAEGNPLVIKYDLPDELISHRVWDLAYDANTQTFSGVAKPKKEGDPGMLVRVDVSGTEPVFELIPATATVIDGQVFEGLPKVTFGAAIIDVDGTLYVGGNSGDHDMNDATGSSGGFYRVDIDEVSGEATLVLVADAPRASSNDGAADPRALDPFQPVDVGSSVLIRDITMVEDPSDGISFDDVVDGNAGSDTIFGNQGDDQLSGSSAGDIIDGGSGDDAVYGGAAPDQKNPDIISFYDENGLRYDQFGNLLEEDDDVLSGGAGDDFLDGSAGHDQLSGDEGNDTLSGGSGHDVLYGGDGDDHLSGGRENDLMHGDAGLDTLEGGSGDDTLYGGSGADVLNGGSGADALYGGEGNDSLSGRSDDDLMYGDAGLDILDGGSGDDTLHGGAGDDSLKGSSGDDQLYGGDGADQMRGDQGDDRLEGGAGADKINGGSGADVLEGGTGKDYLNGSSGDDSLSGGEGADRLYLGAGDDLASGGAGSDRFVFREEDLDGGSDRITDFRNDGTESDSIDLRQLDMLGEMSEADWLLTNVSLNQDGSVTVDLEGSSLIFDSRGDGLGQDYYQEICDSFLF